MSADATAHIQPPAPTEAVPLRFKTHNFAAHCYNTEHCSVVYDDYDFTRPYHDTPAPAPQGADYKKHWAKASYLGVHNFPAPAAVRWTSKDGTAHEAQVNIADIFKNELIWHDVAKADMANFYEGPVAGSPDIVLEVNDRTINVYNGMLIPTRSEQIPGNKYSYSRNDLFLVWTQTY